MHRAVTTSMDDFGLRDGEGLRVLNPDDEALSDEDLRQRIKDLKEATWRAEMEQDVRRAIEAVRAGRDDISSTNTLRGWQYRVARQRLEVGA